MFRIEKYRLTKRVAGSVEAYMRRGFSGKSGVRRVLIAHHPRRISYSQIYPFFYYAKELRARYGVEFRSVVFNDLMGKGRPLLEQADILLLQPWFSATPEQVRQACDTALGLNPRMEISFLDSYAHNDLRMAAHLPDALRFYVKKSLFTNPRDYLKAYRGDTNLNEYYSGIAGLPAEPVDFGVPENILPKLRLGAGFFTAPHTIKAFTAPAPPPQAGRGLDMQSRLGANGSPWYSAMRSLSNEAVSGLDGVSQSPTGKLDFNAFMAEMRDARLCFSPFGYGELCWRDIEAIQTGAVMIKQDMSHLDTLPDLYEAGVTYLPVKWDLSNLGEVVSAALADEAMRSRIAQAAYDRIAIYLREKRFVEDMSFLFSPSIKTKQGLL